MENATELKAQFVLFFIAGLGDFMSTYYALTKGFVETRPYFVPFLSTVILCFCVFVINRLQRYTLKKYHGLICWLLVCFSFSGLLWNLFVLLVS